MARLQRSPSRKVLAAVVTSAALALLPVTAGEALADSGPASGYGTGGSSYSGTYSAQDGGGSYRGGSATAAPAPQPAPTRAYTSGGGSYQGGSATAAPAPQPAPAAASSPVPAPAGRKPVATSADGSAVPAPGPGGGAPAGLAGAAGPSSGEAPPGAVPAGASWAGVVPADSVGTRGPTDSVGTPGPMGSADAPDRDRGQQDGAGTPQAAMHRAMASLATLPGAAAALAASAALALALAAVRSRRRARPARAGWRVGNELPLPRRSRANSTSRVL